MSTKIYDAYRMPADVDIFVFQARVRELADPVRSRLDARLVVERAAHRLTHDLIIGTDKDDQYAGVAPAFAAAYQFTDEQAELKPSSALHDPHRLEISFIAHDEWVGVKLFVSRPDYAAVIEALADEFGIEEYHYQNSTDGPDDVNEADWDARGVFWDEAIGRHTWAERGLSFTLAGTPSIWAHDIQAAADDSMVPSRRSLAIRVASELVLKAAASNGVGGAFIMSNTWSYTRTQDYAAVFIDTIAAALPDLTVEALFHLYPVGETPAVTPQMLALADETAQVITQQIADASAGK